MTSPLLTVASVVLVLVLCVGVVLLSRAVRARVAGDVKPTTTRRRGRAGGRDWAVTPLPTGLARALTQRGLVNAEQLASMSAAEREFFVNTVAARVGETGKPRLLDGEPSDPALSSVSSSAGSPSIGNALHRGFATPTGAATVPSDRVPSSALISGVIHCPVCRSPLGQRAETPLLVARCPGCTRRVAARVDGDRLTITLDYGSRQSGESR